MIDQHDDDKPIGRVLTRREMLKLLGGAGAALILGGAGITKLQAQTGTPAPTPTLRPTATGSPLPSCVVRPALTEGPYFVDGVLNRTDIRIEPTDNSVKEGVQLNLIFNVSNISDNACTPLAGAHVDVWHCDAMGNYSGFTDTGAGFDTVGETWLRGYQLTDEYGVAGFTSIFPGWYSGRAVHIHFKIRTDPEAETGYEFTSQLFFEQDFISQIYQLEPYHDKGEPDMLNTEDGIFQGSEGLLTLQAYQEEDGSVTAIFGIGLDLSNPPEEAGGGGMGGPGGQPPRGTPGAPPPTPGS